MPTFPPEVTFAIYALSSAISFSLVCAGISYIIQVCRTTSHYRYDSADDADAAESDAQEAAS